MVMKILALDIGESRTGLASSDPMGIAVEPLRTVATSELINEIRRIVRDESSIGMLVIGLPKNKDGRESEQTHKVRRVADRISCELGLKIAFENEVMTSQEAKCRLKERGVRLREENKGLIDIEAACVILEQFFQHSSCV